MASAVGVIMRVGHDRSESRLIRSSLAFFCFLAVSAVLPDLYAQETVVHLDPDQTKVEFSVGSTLHTVHGTFKLKSGDVRFDPTTGKASGAIVVAATSGDSENDGRDKKMHEKVLESDKFPEVVFSPAHVQGKIAAQGSSELEVAGTFMLHGQGHDMTMTVTVEPRAGNQIQAATHFGVPYVKWGLKSPSNFMLKVDDTVDVEIHATGQIASDAPHN
jgi:polyisoprenoid-binding protein YceI